MFFREPKILRELHNDGYPGAGSSDSNPRGYKNIGAYTPGVAERIESAFVPVDLGATHPRLARVVERAFYLLGSQRWAARYADRGSR